MSGNSSSTNNSSNSNHRQDEWTTVVHSKTIKQQRSNGRGTNIVESFSIIKLWNFINGVGIDHRVSVPCRYFLQGYCAAGSTCSFSHNQNFDTPLCKFFASSNCKYGKRCTLSHQIPPTLASSQALVSLPPPPTTTLSCKESTALLVPSLPSNNNCEPFTGHASEHDMLPAGLIADLMLDDHHGRRRRFNCADSTTPFGTISFAQSAQFSTEKGEIENSMTFNMTSQTTGATISTGSTIATVSTSVSSSSSSSPPSPVIVSILGNPQQKSNDLCAFAMVGKCRYGNLCRNIHGLQCPRCLRYCLHPHDVDKNEEHIEECLGKVECQSPSYIYDVECGICLERIALKEDPRFGLLNCDHAFCLSCIRTWRSKHTMSDFATKSCPLCRMVTYFIIPSSTWTTNPIEKQKIIDAYKKKLGEINCKYFNSGDNVCPFGGSCFYAHKYRDGNREKPSSLRSYVDKNEQHRTIRETRLCDFIDFQLCRSEAK